MNVTVLTGARFDLALERFHQREDVLAFDAFSLALDHDGALLVRVDSSFNEPTEETAQRDWAEAAAALDRLLDKSPEIRAAVAHRPRRYVVLVSYGQGATRVATAEGERFEWGRS